MDQILLKETYIDMYTQPKYMKTDVGTTDFIQS